MSFFKSFFTKHLPAVLSLVVLVAIGLVLAFGLGEKKAESAWYSSGGTWSYRKQISVDHKKVATTSALTNFPMLFTVTDPDLKHTSFGGKVASTTGGDLIFTNADGSTLLDYEIEKYASTTGELIAWVEVPSLSGVTNTNLFVYFGNASASNNQNPAGVWDSNYKGVWHLPNGTTLTALDSTSNANNGTNSGTVTATTGKVDGGALFDSATEYINFGTGASINNITVPFTFSGWFNPNSASLTRTLMSRYELAFDHKLAFIARLESGNFNVYLSKADGSYQNSSYGSVSLDTWHYYTVVVSGSAASPSLAITIDGIKQTFTPLALSTSLVTTAQTRIGAVHSGDTDGFSGSQDEARISNVARGDDWIATEYTNQKNPSSFYSYGAVGIESRTNTSVKQAYKGSSSLSWYNTSWLYRKQITIDRTKVATTSSLTNFPLLVSTTDPDLKHTSFGGKVASTTGGDLLFTNADGSTLLDYEIEKYASTTGELIAWVEVPTLSGVTDTNLFMYFGNASASNNQNPSGVWDSNYKGVWHLPNGTTLGMLDSTSNANNGINSGTVTASTGKVDGGAFFDSTSEYINFGTGASINNITVPFTFSGWFNPNSGALTRTLMSRYEFAFTHKLAFIARLETGVFKVYLSQSDGSYQALTYSGSPSLDTWHYYTAVVSGSAASPSLAITIDGSKQTFTPAALSTSLVTTAQTRIGEAHSGGGEGFSGSQDEARISNVARGDDWIATEYTNQKNPSTFLMFGGVQAQTLQTPSGGVAPQMKVRGGVKFK